MTRIKLYIAICLIGTAGGVGLCPAAEILEEAVTKPSEDRAISFIRPGMVAEVLVKDGETVKKGQLLARLEDAAERVQLEQLKATADDTTEIEAETAQLEHAKVELQLKEEAHKNGVAPELEVRRAKIQVTIADARVKIAEFNHRINVLKHEEAKLRLDRMHLKSPIDGIVEAIVVDEGEAVDTQMRPVMRVIRIDPMWIDVTVPTKSARTQLNTGQAAEVIFEPGIPTLEGKIIKIAADADAASDTVLVRVEAPNPNQRGTGETVTVRFAPTGQP